jgi:hypothetical protein
MFWPTFCLIELIFKSLNTREEFFVDISTLEDEITSLSYNVGNQIPGGEASPHSRRTVNPHLQLNVCQQSLYSSHLWRKELLSAVLNFPANDPIIFIQFTVVIFSTPEIPTHSWPIFMSSLGDWVITRTTCFAWGGWKLGHDWWLIHHAFSVIDIFKVFVTLPCARFLLYISRILAGIIPSTVTAEIEY